MPERLQKKDRFLKLFLTTLLHEYALTGFYYITGHDLIEINTRTVMSGVPLSGVSPQIFFFIE